MRVRLYPGVDAEQDLLFPAHFRAERVQPVKLRIRIHDDQPDAALCGKFELALQFVVPVQAHFCRGKTRFQRSIKLPARHDVDTAAFALHDLIDCHAGKRFRGIQNEPVPVIIGTDRIAVRPAHVADILLIHDIQRRSELFCQFYGIRSADLEMPELIDLQSFACVHKQTFAHIVFYLLILSHFIKKRNRMPDKAICCAEIHHSLR